MSSIQMLQSFWPMLQAWLPASPTRGRWLAWRRRRRRVVERSLPSSSTAFGRELVRAIEHVLKDAHASPGRVRIDVHLAIVPHELLVAPMLLSVGCVVLVAIAARGVTGLACLLPFGFTRRETAFASWVGLRGAVPIYLTIIPALSNVAGAEFLLPPTFVVVVASLVVQGWTIGPVARALGSVQTSRRSRFRAAADVN